MGRIPTPAWGDLFVYLLLYAWVLRKKSAEAEESCGFFEYSFVFTFICMGFMEVTGRKSIFCSNTYGF